MRLLFSVLVAGCGFHVAAGGSGGPAADASDAVVGDAPDDAMPPDPDAPDASLIDAPMVAPCNVQATASGAAISVIGGSGGSHQGNASCMNGGLPIGLQFDVTPTTIAPHNNQLLMVNVRVRCARVQRLSNGVMQTTNAEQVTITGGMGSSPTACDAYFPTNATGEVLCPSGQVMVGITGNKVDPNTLYNTVGIVCSTLSSNGVPGGAAQMFPIAGTGTNSNQPQASSCPAGQAMTSFAMKWGCGQDGLTPTCAPLACQ